MQAPRYEGKEECRADENPAEDRERRIELHTRRGEHERTAH